MAIDSKRKKYARELLRPEDRKVKEAKVEETVK